MVEEGGGKGEKGGGESPHTCLSVSFLYNALRILKTEGGKEKERGERREEGAFSFDFFFLML